MTAKQLFTALILMTWMFTSSPWAYAQLLEGKNKLKTSKRERRFVLFGSKPKTKAPSHERKDFRQKRPRYSKAAAGKGNYRKRKPKQAPPASTAAHGQGRTRYGKSSVGRGNYRTPKPKQAPPASTAAHGQGRTRYGKSSVGQGNYRKPKPKQAPPASTVAYTQKRTRYGKSSVGRGNYRTPKPKQAPPASTVAYTQKRTRYGTSSVGQGNYPKHKIKAEAPRESRQFAYKVKPRFSKPVAYQRIKLPSQQRRQTFFGMALYKRPYSNKLNGGKGTKKRTKQGLYAKQDYNSCPKKITHEKEKPHSDWVRMKAGNPIKHKAKKAKFDKNEAGIWNN